MFIATFYTHYGAQAFYNELHHQDVTAKMMPVPRTLSASCGICVSFSVEMTASIKKEPPEDMEALYLFTNSHYVPLYITEE